MIERAQGRGVVDVGESGGPMCLLIKRWGSCFVVVLRWVRIAETGFDFTVEWMHVLVGIE